MRGAYLLDVGLRGGAISLLALLALRLLPRTSAGAIAGGFTLTLAAYLLCSAPFWDVLPPWLRPLLLFGGIANPFLFWLFTRAIFEDGFRPHWQHGVALLGLEALGVLALADSDAAISAIARLALQALNVSLAIAALVTAHRGRAPDLVEARRNLRTWLVTSAGAYMVLVILIEAFLRGAAPPAAASLLNAAAIFIIVLGFSAVLIQPSANLLFEQPRAPSTEVVLDAASRELRARLDAAIAERVLLQESLSIGELARQLAAPEHQLRALINAKLGFRNFNDFLNQHRVALACQQLADPALARTPVLTLALNLGYGSIGPFNRAFKQATGLTPTAFRRQKLGTLNAQPHADNGVSADQSLPISKSS